MNKLAELILRKIQDHGPMRFAEFMELALYHPEFGYYMRTSPKIGPSGDFMTAPEYHGIFGATISEHTAHVWMTLDRPDDFNIVEFGAGNASMASALLSHLEMKYPGLFRNLKYTIIETSPALVKVQQQKMEHYLDKVTWIDNVSSRPAPINGFIVANEIVDALPVHIVKKESGIMHEVFVDSDSSGFFEILRPLSVGTLQDYFDELGISLIEGQRCEVNLRALGWMKDLSQILKSGVAVIIDYGYTAEEMFSQRHAEGTLTCYDRHQYNYDPFRNIGEQDITSHVDFTSLITHATRAGFAVERFIDQGKYLLDEGILDLMQSAESLASNPLEIIKTREAVKELISPTTMGKIFKVLVLHK